ncbi:MAG: FtsX-like permease family protein, partial [Eggerthellaceae bacterium]|nr:FtsX-like permease family protein [Eggerthellaceae bacterium]
PGECLISGDKVLNTPASIGDTITITSGVSDVDETLNTTEYTIVGFVRSSYYVSTSNLGSTSLGSGTLGEYMYVPTEDFVEDLPYTEAFVSVKGAKDLESGTDEYQNLIDEVMSNIEAIAPEREQARLDGLKSDAQAQIDEATETYESEKADAEAQLDDTQKQLDDSLDQLNQSKAQLDDAKVQLDDAAATLSSSKVTLDESEVTLRDSKVELDDAKATLDSSKVMLDDTEATLAASKVQLEEAARQLAEAQEQIDEGQASYDAGVAELAEQREEVEAQLSAAQAQIDEKRTLVDQAAEQLPSLEEQRDQLEQAIALIESMDPVDEERLAELEAALEQVNAGIAQIEDSIEQLDQAQAELDAQSETAYAQLAAAQQQLDEAAAELASARAELAAGQQEYDEGLAAYNSGYAQYSAGLSEYEAGLAQYNSGYAQYEDGVAQYNAGYAQYEEGLAEYNSSLAEYEDGLAQYNDGYAQYLDGLGQYEDAKASAEQQFKDAEDQIQQAKNQLADLSLPEWLIMDRTKNMGAVSFASDAARIGSIASIFPFIFFLVAALVALTTMTRMVDEERLLIGTYKALGYSRMAITTKYLLYAGIASFVGAVLGILLLSELLPWTIMQAYAIVYSVPISTLPIDIGIAIGSAFIGVGITIFATVCAAMSSLRESSAALMQPKAPKAGKRILLERIGPLWSKMSFSWKVTWRNLFRYKQRFFMTIIGIAGCTGLLLTGLGLSNSINDIIDKQFDELVKYNVVVTVDDGSDQTTLDQVGSYTETYASAQTTSLIATGPDKDDYLITLIVPQELATFDDIWTVRNRITHQAVELNSDSVAISEKLATLLGIDVGDTITLAVQDSLGNATDETYDATVTAYFENYVYNYVLMGSDAYESVFGKAPDYQSIYAVVPINEDSDRSVFDGTVRSIDGVNTVAFNDEIIKTYKSMLSSVNIIVVVLVVAAALLAFIVLYNLTNINITERKREIATLKVLGFTPSEVDLYIYREIILLSIIGGLLGLLFGYVLESFVVVTAEIDQVMFGREIHWWSYLVAYGMTIVFTLIVMIFMRPKLKAIDMVESLKSNE